MAEPPDTPNTGVLMFVAYRSMEQRIFEAVHAAGFADVTLAQGRFFARIQQQGNRLTELAEMAQVTKQTAQFMVDQLEKHGYVTREPDPTDARARLVRIAPRGRAAQDVAQATEQAIEREWAHHLGAERMAALRDAVVRLREITDPYAG